jgi:hypothetical protein
MRPHDLDMTRWRLAILLMIAVGTWASALWLGARREAPADNVDPSSGGDAGAVDDVRVDAPRGIVRRRSPQRRTRRRTFPDSEEPASRFHAPDLEDAEERMRREERLDRDDPEDATNAKGILEEHLWWSRTQGDAGVADPDRERIESATPEDAQ